MMHRFARGFAGTAISAAMTVLLPNAALAQLPERPCRIVFDDTTWGKVDKASTHGEIRLGPRMAEPGGGFMMMGQGTLKQTFEKDLRDGCTIISGAEKTVPIQAFVSSENGKIGEVDIMAMDDSHRITFKCLSTPGQGSVDEHIIVPPTVTIPLLHGASVDYEDSDPGGRTGVRGKMQIEYCRQELQ
jgi:hypothetical protein